MGRLHGADAPQIELLDEFLEPFQEGRPKEDIAHLVAINDGRLLEWIEGVEARRSGNETPLTKELYDLLQGDSGDRGIARPVHQSESAIPRRRCRG